MSIDTTRARGRRGGAGGRRRPGQRRFRRPGRPRHGRAWSPTPAARGSSCTGAGTRAGWRDLAVYDDVVERGARRAARAGRRRASRPGVDAEQLILDPGPRLRQDAPSTTGGSPPTCPTRRARLPGAGRREPQVATSGRCSPARTGRRARPTSGRRRRSPPPCSRSPPGAWGVRVHDVRAHRGRARGRGRPSRGAGCDDGEPTATDHASPGCGSAATTASSTSSAPTARTSWSTSSLELDLAPAAAADDVADTVHYGELAEQLAAVVAGEPVNLIETLAERLADVCLATTRVAPRRSPCTSPRPRSRTSSPTWP